MPMWWTLLAVASAAPPGTYDVARSDVVFDHPDQGTIWFTAHYPAINTNQNAAVDHSGGPYPMVAFLHGYLGAAWMYADAADHMASLGTVVLNIDTETHPFLSYETFARDTHASMVWADAQSGDPNHWLYEAIAPGDWTATGHSMGGATLARLIQLEPRVRTLVGFMPYSSGEARDDEAFADFDGAALYLAGTDDTTATPDIVRAWYERMDRTHTGLYFNIDGAGHQAISDFEWAADTMDDSLQREVVLQLASDFLRSEVLGEAEAQRGLLYDLPADMVEQGSRSQRTSLWLDLFNTVPATTPLVELGALAQGDGTLSLFGGTGPGTTSTSLGTIALQDATLLHSTPLTEGRAADSFADVAQDQWLLAVLESPAGIVYGTPTDLFGIGLPPAEPDPDPAVDPEVPPTEDETPPTEAVEPPQVPERVATTTACSHLPAPAALPLGLAFAGLLRRRRRA